MRFSAVTALCAAPLALAGSLQSGLEARQAVGVEVNGQPVSGSQTIQGAANGNNNIQIQGASGSSLTEVIIIWVNNGGNAATQTINTAFSTAGSASLATHSVR